MAKPCIVRLDGRLIHGQVLKAWIRHLSLEHICIVDDNLANDAYLPAIYQMSVPKGTTTAIHTIEDFVSQWPTEIARRGEPWMLMFRKPADMKAAWDQGAHFDSLQIAGRGSNYDRIRVYEAVSLSEEDAKLLQQLHDQGLRIYFQTTPQSEPQAYLEAVEPVYPHIIAMH